MQQRRRSAAQFQALTGSKIASPIAWHNSYLGPRLSDFYQLASHWGLLRVIPVLSARPDVEQYLQVVDIYGPKFLLLESRRTLCEDSSSILAHNTYWSIINNLSNHAKGDKDAALAKFEARDRCLGLASPRNPMGQDTSYINIANRTLSDTAWESLSICWQRYLKFRLLRRQSCSDRPWNAKLAL